MFEHLLFQVTMTWIFGLRLQTRRLDMMTMGKQLKSTFRFLKFKTKKKRSIWFKI